MARTDRFDEREQQRRDYEDEGRYGRRFGRPYDYDPERGRFDTAKRFADPGVGPREDQSLDEQIRYSINRDFGRPMDYDDATKRFQGDVPAEEERQGRQGMREEGRAWDRERERYQTGGYYEERAIGGPYYGVGPKGYKRSDRRVREDVCDMLTMAGQIDATDVDVEVHYGEVTLKGSVRDRYEKRFAEDIAFSVIGVTDVQNQLRVAGERQQARTEATRSPERLEMIGDEWQLRVRPGMEVVDAQGEHIGTVKAVRSTDFLVDRRMARDIYIPCRAISSCDRKVKINVEKGRINDMGWAKPELA